MWLGIQLCAAKVDRSRHRPLTSVLHDVRAAERFIHIVRLSARLSDLGGFSG